MGNTTTMIQAKYEPAFAALTPAMLERVMVGLSATRPELHELGDIEDGPTLVDYCRQSGISQAEVVMSMRNDPSPLAVAAVECLLMKPIDRRTPAEVERQRDAERPRPQLATVRSSERTTDGRIIRLLTTGNPKRAGTDGHRRFALYRDGMTVAAFLAAGGRSADIKWDAERSFIRLDDPA